jgi:hypothetical protein
MASIIDTYNEKSKDATFAGNIKTPSDLTPYSIGSGTGLATVDTKLGDKAAITALETKLSVNRYGSGILAAGADDSTKEYSSATNVNK